MKLQILRISWFKDKAKRSMTTTCMQCCKDFVRRSETQPWEKHHSLLRLLLIHGRDQDRPWKGNQKYGAIEEQGKQNSSGNGKFVQFCSMCIINAPIRHLLKQSSEFVWDSQHNDAFKKMKELTTKLLGPVLVYYDPQKELHLQVDALKYGLGVVLLQNVKPLTYASRSLTECEVVYAQIEEFSTVLFDCKPFHH